MQLFLDHDRGIYHFHVFVFPGNLINVQYYASNEDKISRANVNKQTRLEYRVLKGIGQKKHSVGQQTIMQ